MNQPFIINLGKTRIASFEKIGLWQKFGSTCYLMMIQMTQVFLKCPVTMVTLPYHCLHIRRMVKSKTRRMSVMCPWSMGSDNALFQWNSMFWVDVTQNEKYISKLCSCQETYFPREHCWNRCLYIYCLLWTAQCIYASLGKMNNIKFYPRWKALDRNFTTADLKNEEFRLEIINQYFR